MTIIDDGVYGDFNDVRIGDGDVKDEEVVPDKSSPLHWMTEWDATYCETTWANLKMMMMIIIVITIIMIMIMLYIMIYQA